MTAQIPFGAPATDEELMRISARNPGWRVERAPGGDVLMTPPTGSESSRRNALLTRLLCEWAESHGYVAFDSNGGFRLPDTSVVAPDASLVPLEQWAALTIEQREGFFPDAPAVAVELCSQTDDPRELRAKLERLRRAGTSYVVLIDPYRAAIWTDGTPPADFSVDLKQLL
jgi:Uma2 family endonuclease